MFNKVLYTGITSNLIQRVYEHKKGLGSKFTSKYKVIKLVYYELYDDPENAILREKQIKGWKRDKKIKLIKTMNPNFKDLYLDIAK